MRWKNVQQPSRMSLMDRWLWKHHFNQRQDAIKEALDRDGGLQKIQSYIDSIGELESERGQTGSRDALELWNMAAYWIQENRPQWVRARQPEGDNKLVFSGSGFDGYLPSNLLPRLDRSTVAALGNEKLLRARDDEDKFVDWRIRRAARKCPNTANLVPADLTPWVDRYCQGDHDFAVGALELLEPDKTRQTFKELHNYGQKHPDHTIPPWWFAFEIPRQEEYRQQVAQLSEYMHPFGDELADYVRWRAELIEDLTETFEHYRDVES